MLKVRNRLLIAVVLLAMALSAGLYGRSEARALRSATTYHLIKPGPGTNTGEPDSGDTGRNGLPTPNDDPGDGGSVVRLPIGYRWVFSVWSVRYLGVGW
jgi:hypothetical protein